MDATVAQYVTWLSNGEADLTLAAQLYLDAIDSINAMHPMLVKLTSVPATANGATSLPGDTNALLLAFYNQFQLGELSVREANWLFPNWRQESISMNRPAGYDQPYNFVRESYSQQTLQLLPFILDVALEVPQPVQLLTSYAPEPAVPTFLQMPVALLVLAEEYLRESPHQNVPLSMAFRALSMLLLSILAR